MAKSFIEDFKQLVRTGNILVKIVLVNAAIFLISNILVHIARYDGFVDYLELPGTFQQIVTRFWTPFTYMFFHLSLGHVFWNMVWLYSMGRIFMDMIGARRVMFVYILGGLSGALLYLVTNQFVLLSFSLIGASAAVMAIVVAVAAVAPNYVVHMMLIGPVRLKYIALFSFIITTLLDFSLNTGGKIAHLGGALFGLLYGLQYKQGRDLGKGISELFKRKPKSHLKVKYKKKPVTDEDYNASRVVEQQVIDAILDKISKSGYDSLSKKEKEILFRASNRGDRGF